MLIVISPPENLSDETQIVNRLFDLGLERFHLRKPNATEKCMGDYLNEIAPQHRSRIVLHQCHQLASVYGISRVHDTAVARSARESFDERYRYSTSVHDPAEAALLGDMYEYYFIGPLFTSLSKAGYGPLHPNGDALRQDVSARAVALGGITPQRLPEVSARGYTSAAVLGYIWQAADAVSAYLELKDKWNKDHTY